MAVEEGIRFAFQKEMGAVCERGKEMGDDDQGGSSLEKWGE